MSSQLNLYFPYTQDTRTIEIQDISLYDTNIKVTNASLKINIPDDSTDYFVQFKVKGNTFITSNSLGITSTNCKQGLSYLPDGIYNFTYSICPNETVFYKTSILRDQNTRQQIYIKLSPFYGDCSNTAFSIYGQDITSQTRSKYETLLLILDIAQALVQDYKPDQAQELLDYVVEALNN